MQIVGEPVGLAGQVDEPILDRRGLRSLAVLRRASDIASMGFKGSSTMITSAPRPVKTPLTEVAIRNPPFVVTSSWIAARDVARRVGYSF